jgi:hypothetical protein
MSPLKNCLPELFRRRPDSFAVAIGVLRNGSKGNVESRFSSSFRAGTKRMEAFPIGAPA